MKDLLKDQCYEEVMKLPGVTSVAVEMTAQVRERQTAPQDLIPGVKHVHASCPFLTRPLSLQLCWSD